MHEKLTSDPLHNKIIQTKDDFVSNDNFDTEEAIEAAVEKRKFLFKKLLKIILLLAVMMKLAKRQNCNAYVKSKLIQMYCVMFHWNNNGKSGKCTPNFLSGPFWPYEQMNMCSAHEQL